MIKVGKILKIRFALKADKRKYNKFLNFQMNHNFLKLNLYKEIKIKLIMKDKKARYFALIKNLVGNYKVGKRIFSFKNKF